MFSPPLQANAVAVTFTMALLAGYAATSRAQDPFADKPDEPAVAEQPAQAEDPPAFVQPVAETCRHVTSAACLKQNELLGLLAAGYVALSVLCVSIWRAWWNRRGTSTAGVRLWIPMFVGALGAALLVGFHPARGADLECCLAHPVFRAEILLEDAAVARAALFGAAPAIALYFAVVLATGAVRALKGRA